MMKGFLSIAPLLFCFGCASAPVQPTAPPTREELQTLAVDESSNKHVYRARHNPPLCPCPPFEVFVGARWIRVVLVEQDEDRPRIGDLNLFASEPGESSEEELFLIGTLEPDRIQYSATGFPLTEFVLEGFTNSDPGGLPESGESAKKAE